MVTGGRWAGRLLFAAVAILVFVGLGPATGAYRLATVLSGSMAPAMPVGSVAVLVPESPAAVRVGDVLTFQAPTPGHPVVTHRVVEIVEAGRHPVIRTKGDANSSPDPWTARLEGDRAWRRVAVVPYAGTAIRFLRSPAVHHLSVQVAPVLLLLCMLAAIWFPGRLRRDVTPAPAPPVRPASPVRPARTFWRPTRLRTVALATAFLIAMATPAAATMTSTSSASGSVGTAADWMPPSVSATAIAKTTSGYLAGSIKPSGTYYVYANVADSGNPAVGISTVKADVSTITTGQTAVTLTAGSYSINGVSYNYRSGSLTGSGNPVGSKSYTITSTDASSHQQTQNGYSVTLDNSGPTATNISTTNVGGGTHGKAETGDTITFTFSEQVDPESILSGWTGASTNVTVVFSDGGCGLLILCGNDSFDIENAAHSASLPFGSIDLKDDTYYGCSGFGILCSSSDAMFVNSPMVQSGAAITITLGTRSGGSGSFNTASSNVDMAWHSTTTPFDAAGNIASGNTFTETDNDYEF